MRSPPEVKRHFGIRGDQPTATFRGPQTSLKRRAKRLGLDVARAQLTPSRPLLRGHPLAATPVRDHKTTKTPAANNNNFNNNGDNYHYDDDENNFSNRKSHSVSKYNKPEQKYPYTIFFFFLVIIILFYPTLLL